jgi:hypothetical protein
MPLIGLRSWVFVLCTWNVEVTKTQDQSPQSKTKVQKPKSRELENIEIAVGHDMLRRHETNFIAFPIAVFRYSRSLRA